MGAASEAAWPGARGTGETEQAGVVDALRASPAAAGTVGERLPRGAGALSGGVEDRLRWERVSLEKRIPKRCGGSRARRENSTARAWKGRRNGRGRRRGRTGSY